MFSYLKKSGGRMSRRNGYTLMEIMLVLAIIAVLLSSGIYYLVGNLDVAREQRVRSDIQTITTQLRVYEMQNLFLPTDSQVLDALVNPPTLDPKPPRWRQLLQAQAFTDPWGMPY